AFPMRHAPVVVLFNGCPDMDDRERLFPAALKQRRRPVNDLVRAGLKVRGPQKIVLQVDEQEGRLHPARPNYLEILMRASATNSPISFVPTTRFPLFARSIVRHPCFHTHSTARS